MEAATIITAAVASFLGAFIGGALWQSTTSKNTLETPKPNSEHKTPPVKSKVRIVKRSDEVIAREERSER